MIDRSLANKRRITMAWTPFTRGDHDRTSLRYTSDLSDREFALIAPHLPGQPKRGRKRRVCLRCVISGIFYVLQNGCAWANLPAMLYAFPFCVWTTAERFAHRERGASSDNRLRASIFARAVPCRRWSAVLEPAQARLPTDGRSGTAMHRRSSRQGPWP